MKKILFAVAALFSMATSFAQKQGDDNGLGVRLNVGICGSTFGDESLYETSSGKLIESYSYADDTWKRHNTPLFGLSVDNRWYIAKPSNGGIAIDARWLDFGFGKSTFTYDGEKDDDYYTTLKMDFLMPGVIGTIYLANNMAIDAFYNIGPSMVIEKEKSTEDDESYTNAEFGLSHYLGAALRYKMFQFGVEYNISKPKTVKWFDDDEEYEEEDLTFCRIKRNNLRIFVGCKF